MPSAVLSCALEDATGPGAIALSACALIGGGTAPHPPDVIPAQAGAGPSRSAQPIQSIERGPPSGLEVATGLEVVIALSACVETTVENRAGSTTRLPPGRTLR